MVVPVEVAAFLAARSGDGMTASWQPPAAPSRPLSRATRARRHKWRVKHEMIHIHGLDLPLRSVAALVKLLYLDEGKSEDRQAIRAAVERYLSEKLALNIR